MLPEARELFDDVKHIYKKKYGVQYDDDIIAIFVRINQMEKQISDKIDAASATPKPARPIDFFYYGMGKMFIPGLVLAVAVLVYFVLR